MWNQLYALAAEENGPTAIEYALIAAFVAIAIIAALILLGGALANIFGYVGNSVNNVPG
jgi:Flp pilus assembly pilin Flp